MGYERKGWKEDLPLLFSNTNTFSMHFSMLLFDQSLKKIELLLLPAHPG